MKVNVDLSSKQLEAFKILNDNETTELFYGGGAGGGKAQPLTSKILTPKGWKEMGKISVGDEILSQKNKVKKVIAIHPQGKKEIYEVKFIDGSKTYCCKEHLWDCWVARKKRYRKIRSTEEIIKLMDCGKNIIIPLSKPLDFGEAYSKISPYLIGVLLGDGNSKSMKITSSDEEIIENLRKEGYFIKKTKEYHYSIITSKRNNKGHLYSDELNELKSIGMMKRVCGNKKIPKVIMDGDLKTRLSAIKGLMDTDGTIDSRGHCSFTSKSLQLVKDMQYLIRSIGGKATLSKKKKYCTYKRKKIQGIYYELYINTNDNSQLFNLTRKKNRVKKYNGGYELGKRIKSIKLFSFEEAKCITIEGDEQLYITDDFTVTHNSYLGCVWIIQCCIRYPGSRWLMGRARLKSLKESTFLTFLSILRDWGLKKDKDYRYNAMESHILFNNGSSVYLKDLFLYPTDPEFDSLGSTEYTGAFIDEVSEITEKAKNIVMSRIRYKLEEYNLIPKLLLASNPAKNFAYREYWKPWKENTLPNYRKFVPALVGDNPFISHHYEKNLQKLDKNSKERLLYGNWNYDDDPSRLFEYDKINDIFTNTSPKNDIYYISVDVARFGKDKSVIIVWKGYEIIEIIRTKKKSTTQIAEKIQQLSEVYRVPRSRIVIDEDGVGGGVVDMMNGVKGFINNSRPIELKREQTPKGAYSLPPKHNFGNLKAQCYFKLAELVNNAKISFKTENIELKEMIVEDLEQIKVKDIEKDGKLLIVPKEEIIENLGRSPDVADALMMRMIFEFKHKTKHMIFGIKK